MARFVDRLVQDGIDSPIDIIVDPNEIDLIDVRHKRLRHHWWAAQREREGLPSQGDFNISFIAEINDYLTILEKYGTDLRYESFGRGIIRAYGRDLTGQTLAALPSPVTHLFRSLYHLCEQKKVPVFTRHAPISGSAVDYWLRLIVPLCKVDPAMVSRFMVCNVAVGGTVPVRGAAS